MLVDGNRDLSDALSEVLARLLPRVRRLLFRQRIPPWDGEDLVQQALTAACRRGASVAHKEAWLYGTIKNMCIVYWRSRRRRHVADRPNAADFGRDQVERRRRLDLLLDVEIQSAKLSRRHRRLLFMRYQLGMTLAEIAAEMAICRSHVLRQEQLALERLRRLMLAASAADRHHAEPEARRLADALSPATRHRTARGRPLAAAVEDLEDPPQPLAAPNSVTDRGRRPAPASNS